MKHRLRPLIVRSILLLTGLAFIGIGIAASPAPAATPKQGGELKVGINTDLTGTDPHSTPSHGDAAIFNHVFEPFIGYSDTLEVKPVLAERWEIDPEFKSYTFYLRKGKLFHNGREMTAEDAQFSIQRLLDPKVRCPRRSLLKNIDRVDIVDKYTIRVHMKKKDASLLTVLAYTTPVLGVVPKAETLEAGGLIKTPIGTGPFKFVEWKPDRHVILERFEEYKPQPGKKDGLAGERTAYVDRIKYTPIPEESVSIMALLNKEVDLLMYFPPKYVDKYEKSYKQKGLVLVQQSGLGWYEIFFGCAKPMTDNVKFRQACAHAIDRNKIVQAATLGFATPNASLVPKTSRYFTPYHTTWYKKDLAKAKQLLKEAGYNGEEIAIDTTKKYIYMYRQGVAVQSELAGAGIKTKLNVLEWPVLVKKYRKGDYQIMSFAGAGRGDPVLAYSSLKRNGFFDQYPEMAKIVDAAKNTVDFEERKALFEKAHKVFYEGVPMVMFFNSNYLNCHQDYVKGYALNPTGQPRFWGVWLDQ